MKEFLSRAGRTFEVRNVDEDLAAYDDLVARGFRRVPVTFIGDAPGIVGLDEAALTRALGGLDEAALTRALEDAGPPSPDR